MTVPELVGFAAVAVYLVFFLLFARFFWWRRLAWRDHFGPRPLLTIGSVEALARGSGRELPRFTIVVPARNEAAVIGKTLDHLSRLDYPASHYEVLVVTDGKEPLEAGASRRAAVAEVMAVLSRPAAGPEPAPDRPPLGPEARLLLLQLLSAQAVREYFAARSRQAGLVVPAGLGWLSREGRAELLREVASLLIAGRGRVSEGRLRACIERLAGPRAAEHLGREAHSLLGLAIPVVAAYADLAGGGDRRLLATMLRQAARAGHRVTEEIIAAMARMIGGRLVRLLDQDASDRPALQRQLDRAAVEALPTTQDIIAQRMEAYGGSGGGSRAVPIRQVEVPPDYDGEFRGRCTGSPVPSTKGRALNYALAFVDPRSEMCGFYDAESRPDRPTLLYVAWRRLVAPGRSRMLQGPVFQVRNLFHLTAVCKIAALYQAVSHEWYLPQLFRRLPFAGGTNFYVERELLYQLGGYDHRILTEDLEFGIRAYVQAGAWPEYLPYGSSEQTPPTVRGFFRQRLRWGTGHLQVMDKLRRDRSSDPGRRRRMLRHLWLKGQLEWSLYQAATMVPPAMLVLHAAGYLDPGFLPVPARVALSLFTAVYFAFTFYIYGRYRGYVDMSARPRHRLGHWAVAPQLALLPLAAFLFPVPYSAAMVLKGLGREPRAWVKTPRTAD